MVLLLQKSITKAVKEGKRREMKVERENRKEKFVALKVSSPVAVPICINLGI
jgi:hypothetical protein